jgi:hypothetical protein
MQGLAANYLDHFELEFGEAVDVRLRPSPPKGLIELAELIRERFGPDILVCLYEALCTVAQSDIPHCAEVDEKVCPAGIYFTVVDFLSERL